MNATLNYSIFTAFEPHCLTKVLGLAHDGSLTKTTTATLYRGKVCRAHAAGMGELTTQLEALAPNQAVAWGVCVPEEAVIVPADDENEVAGAISRTRKHFAYPAGPGVLMLDHDGLPDGELTAEELRQHLIDVCPALAGVTMMWRPSVSAGVVAPDGRKLTDLTRHRLYIPVQDASRIPEMGAALVAMLWAAEQGWFIVGKAGQALPRTLIDPSVWQPERLDFCAPPILNDGLRREHVQPVIFNPEALYLDAAQLAIDLHIERAAAAHRKAALRTVKAECAAQRQRWANEAAPGLAERRGIAKAKAREVLMRAGEFGVLTGDFELISSNGERVAVAELLDHPARWHNKRFADPLDPDDDLRVAVVSLLNGTRPMLYSHRHGGVRYELLRQAARVLVGKGRRAEATDATLQALRDRGDLFDFGENAIAYVAEGRARPVTQDWLGDHLGRVCEFYRLKPARGADSDEPPAEMPEDPPLPVIKSIMAKHGSRGFRKLTAVITAPTLRLDGSVIDRPGHDEASGLLYFCGEGAAPIVPSNPSPADALAALKGLWEPFEKFPIVDAVSRGVLLHGLITAAVRASLPTAPGLGVDTPAAGTGKTLVARCVGILATGQDPAILPPADGDEETRKRLIAVLRDGARVVLWDNLREPLGCAALDSFLTAPTFSDRILGVSETVSLPNRAVFIATGNNLRLSGDTWRRVLVMRLDAECERPYARDFEFDPAQRVLQHRLAFVVAALTIVRAYFAAGRPKCGAGRTASFEDWDDMVRQPICWLAQLVRECPAHGLPSIDDPLKAAEVAFERDPETTKHSALLATWHGAFGSKPTTVAEAVEACLRAGAGALRGALDEIAGQGIATTIINTRMLGRWIEKHVGQRLGGLWFVRGKLRDGITTWAVERAGGSTEPKPLTHTEPPGRAGQSAGRGVPPVGEVPSSRLSAAERRRGSPGQLVNLSEPRYFADLDDEQHADEIERLLR
jgi:hypothetical protein